MKKIIAILPIAILFILLSRAYDSFAYTKIGTALVSDAEWTGNPNGLYDAYINQDNFNSTGYYPYTNYQGYLYIGFGSSAVNLHSIYWYDSIGNRYFALSTYNTRSLYIENGGFEPITLSATGYTTYCYSNYDVFVDNLPPEYRPEVPPDPTWWDELWGSFKDRVVDILELLGYPVQAAINLDNWLEGLFDVKVGEGEDDLAYQINMATPPPPTPTPTPIPYQTVLAPDNNGGFTIQYIYNNPSGTPEPHPNPPSNNITNNYGSDFEYPYYENPENKDNPFQLNIPWYLKLILKNSDVPIDTLDDHYAVAQSEIQDDEVLEAVDTIYNGFQVIPSEWIFLLGAVACLPLFAALIHRMLQG